MHLNAVVIPTTTQCVCGIDGVLELLTSSTYSRLINVGADSLEKEMTRRGETILPRGRPSQGSGN